MKKLIIAEKPSVARDIANVLNIKTKKTGYMEGENYVITWAFGHLVTLCEPADYDKNLKKWNFSTLPILPSNMQIKASDNTKKQFNTINSLIKRDDVSSLICATDAGREGELIFRYIYNLSGSNKPFERLWISSMTNQAIKEGFANLKDGAKYDNLYYSAKCRSEADWLVGINATRAFTCRNNVLLSVGRVQTPTLALIVNRQEEIDNFVPKKYYEAVVNYGEFSGTFFKGKTSNTRIDELEKANEIIASVSGKDGEITKITKKKAKTNPPFLYDLTELQRDGNKIYGYSAKKVLDIAQNLYEKRKLITYPRTDSKFLSKDMKNTVKQTMEKLNVPPYDKAVSKVLNKGLSFSKRIINDAKVSDHHAIIPTNSKPYTANLSKDELNIFNLIVKRFIAIFYDPFVYETTEIVVKSEGHNFVSKGKIVIDKGFKVLYKGDDKESFLPKLEKGDKVNIIDGKVNEKETSPPKLYTENTLLSAMEHAGKFVEDEELKEKLKENGFGTPATRASIIERLLQVKYIVRKGKSLIPTEKGIKLIQIAPAELKSPETTGRWEKGLNKIAKGELDPNRFIESIHRFVHYIVGSANTVQGHFEIAPETNKKIKGHLGICPVCKKGVILENKSAFYCSHWKSGCKMTIWKNHFKGYDNLNAKIIKKLIKEGKIEDFKLKEIKGTAYMEGTLFINEKGVVSIEAK